MKWPLTALQQQQKKHELGNQTGIHKFKRLCILISKGISFFEGYASSGPIIQNCTQEADNYDIEEVHEDNSIN